MVTIDHLESPVGPLTLAEHDGRLCLLHFGRTSGIRQTLTRWYPDDKPVAGELTKIRGTLNRYFQGQIAAIDEPDVELNGTPFQQRVWNALRRIPAGRPCPTASSPDRSGLRPRSALLARQTAPIR